MRKANIIKGIIAILLILVVVVATVNYGKSQRSKISLKDNTKSTLPTVQDNSATKQENNTPSQSKPEQPKSEPAPVVSTPVMAQNTQSQMPATGPADTLLPVLALGVMSGLYFASRRKLKQLG